MSDAIAILGQSNAAHFWETTSSGLTAQSNTFMWSLGVWVSPVNSLITLTNGLNTATGKAVYILPCAVSGSALLAEAAVSNGYWLDTSSGSPFANFKSALSASGANLKGIAWVQGESEAQFGSSIEHYVAGMMQLHGMIAGAAGKKPADIPFLVSPLGNAVQVYSGGRKILQAHLGMDKYAGFQIGPDYHDLAVESDNIHLTEASRNMFATRWAAALIPVLGIQAGSSPALGVPCVQSPVANSTVTTAAHGLGTKPSRVDFYLECLVAELGYSAGDRVPHNSFNYCACEHDASNVRIVTNERSVAVNARNTGSLSNITPANWKAVAQPVLGY